MAILIIDDEEKLRSLLARIIKSEGFNVIEADSCKSGLRKLASNDIDVVICDVRLPDGSGLDMIERLREKDFLVEVILLTAYGNIADGVQATKNGAFDYLVKGDDNDKIIPLLHKAIDKVNLQKRIRELEQKVGKQYSFDNIISRSKPASAAVDLAKKIAPMETAVLLTGETGSGKEVFAQAIHQASSRKSKNFVALNCSTFSKEILESELFGHKEGSFTGASRDQKGLIEEADGGTLFLDEIGEMPLELQAKLLRVLETTSFIRIGDTKPSKSDFRLIAATNKNLKTESEEHRFRPDLYFRLNVFEIHLAPLRERVKDIEPLALYYLEQFSLKMGLKKISMDPDFLSLLEGYSWPGNIRELKNVIERAIILSENDRLVPANLPLEIQENLKMQNGELSVFSMESAEKLHIQKVFHYAKGNKAETARLLQIGIATLYRKIEEYKIK